MNVGFIFVGLAIAQLAALVWGVRLWQQQRQNSTLLLLLPLVALTIAASVLAVGAMLPTLPNAPLQLTRYIALTVLCPFGVLGVLETLRTLDIRWARKPLARTLTWLLLVLLFALGGWGIAVERLQVDTNPPWQVIVLLLSLAAAASVASFYFWRKLNWAWLAVAALLLLIGATTDLWLDSLVATIAGLLFALGLDSSLARLRQAQNVLGNLRERRRF